MGAPRWTQTGERRRAAKRPRNAAPTKQAGETGGNPRNVTLNPTTQPAGPR